MMNVYTVSDDESDSFLDDFRFNNDPVDNALLPQEITNDHNSNCVVVPQVDRTLLLNELLLVEETEVSVSWCD